MKLCLRPRRRQVFVRDDWTCQICGFVTPESQRVIFMHRGSGALMKGGIPNPIPAERRLTVDHIVPRSRGGTNATSNLRAACRICNAKRGNRPIEESP